MRGVIDGERNVIGRSVVGRDKTSCCNTSTAKVRLNEREHCVGQQGV